MSTPPAAEWDVTTSQSIFGWMWPVAHSGPPMLVEFCPEVIDAQTAELDDDDLKRYLDIIQWVCQTHVLWWTTAPDPVHRQHLIEDELALIFPAELSMWERVRFAVLDRRAAAS